MPPPHVSASDFSIDGRRLALLSAFAAVLGAVSALLAKALLSLIGLITHLAYGGTIGWSLEAPDPHRIGPISIIVPVLGALAVGLIARFGSDKIRGHGIPEAIQSILERDSIISGRVAFWKPLASAIAIGTGSPFGAEGPIIMTGGAIGSLCAQFFHLTSFERRTLLVAGAAGGMSATFGAPIASVLLAVELLLFEWRPRSFIPVAVASFVAVAVRATIIGTALPFGALHTLTLSTSMLPWAVAIGLCGGLVSLLMTKSVYAVEDAYERLPIHWMWWPALGAVFVGIGGWFVPAALGVGYPTIDALVNGSLALPAIVTIALMKVVLWVVSLSSGTSGGVLAPLLMIGAAMGSIVSSVLIPGSDHGAGAIVGMAALMGGTMRAPFMATLFALETTHAWGVAPEVFAGCVAATAFTVVFVPRSILTEKLARRGTHVAREYAVHPLELVPVRAIMRAIAITDEKPSRSVGVRDTALSAADMLASSHAGSLAVIDEGGTWVGLVTNADVLRAWRRGLNQEQRRRRVRRFGAAMPPRRKTGPSPPA